MTLPRVQTIRSSRPADKGFAAAASGDCRRLIGYAASPDTENLLTEVSKPDIPACAE
jgi:hypothetical protein